MLTQVGDDMIVRLMILSVLVVVVTLGLAMIGDVMANDANFEWVGEPRVENTPSPHFAFQQQQAQSSGLAQLTLPQPPGRRLPPGQQMRLGDGKVPTTPSELPTRRDDRSIVADIVAEAKKTDQQLNATNIRAIVADGDIVTILIECNCSPKPLLIGRIAPYTTVKYLTFTVDRRYPGHLIAAGPETEETQRLISRGVRAR